MPKFKLFLLGLCIVFTTLACAQSGRVTESERSIESLYEMANQLNISQNEVDNAISAMAELSTTMDLKVSFKNFVRSVNKIQAERRKAKAIRDNMQKNSQKYISKWQMELDAMQDPDVKTALAERKASVKESFEKIRGTLDEVRDIYQPFLTNITEIQRALSLDLNLAGVKAMQSSINKAKTQGDAVKAKIIKAREELEQIAGSMSPMATVK